jgi:thioredoxin-dependent peroxiredoxin
MVRLPTVQSALAVSDEDAQRIEEAWTMADAIPERQGEAFEFDERLTVLGRKLDVGMLAPDYALDTFDTEQGAIRTVRLTDSAGNVRVLNVVNSLDTPVCHIETRRWEDMLANLPQGVVIQTISMDLPFAQARWKAAEGVAHQALSAHKNEQFGRDYGVLIKEWRLLQRAVFVLDGEGRIRYAEYVPDQMREPDYDAALSAARAATTA